MLILLNKLWLAVGKPPRWRERASVIALVFASMGGSTRHLFRMRLCLQMLLHLVDFIRLTHKAWEPRVESKIRQT
jgi:hypothetical protein